MIWRNVIPIGISITPALFICPVNEKTFVPLLDHNQVVDPAGKHQDLARVSFTRVPVSSDAVCLHRLPEALLRLRCKHGFSRFHFKGRTRSCAR